VQGWPLPPFDHPGWNSSDAGMYGTYLFENGHPARRMLLWSRSFAAVWGVLVAALVFLWSRSLFGRLGGWLSLAFCLVDTTLLANAPLATSDVCAAFFFSWSTLAIWRMLQLPSPATALIAAVAVAGLFIAKFSAPLEIVVGAILLVIRGRFGPPWEVAWAGRRRPVSTGAGWAAVAGCLAVVCLVSWLVVWLAYGFRYAGMNPQTAPTGAFNKFGSLAAAAAELGGFKGRLLAFLGEHRILPESFLYGMTYVLLTLLRQSFFCGDYSVSGWWRFFPFTFLVKTPLPTLAGLVLVPVLARWRGPRSSAGGSAPAPGTASTAAAGLAWYPLAPLLTLSGVYWAASITTTLNIGHRHLLPVYPVAFVLVGGLVPLTRGHGGLRRLPWVLVACGALAAAWAFPNYLSFFNGLIGRDHAWRFLVDSNVDWGQEHYTLEAFVARERQAFGAEHPVYGCLFDSTPQQGPAESAVTMLPTLFRDGPEPPLQPGTYCISATHLQGLYLPMWGPWTARREERFQDRLRAIALLEPLSDEERLKTHGVTPELFARIVQDFHRLEYHRLLAQLRERTPDAVINGAILVYRLDAPTLRAILQAGPPAQAARFPGSPADD